MRKLINYIVLTSIYIFSLHFNFTTKLYILQLYAGTNPSVFINTGVGAKALGLGSAFTSVSDDSTALYWNPAGLSKINKFSITGMGQSLAATKWETLRNITPEEQFIGMTIPLKQLKIPTYNNTLGLGWKSCKLENIPYTTISNSGKIIRDTFENYENAYFISYGSALLLGREKILIGVTFKYITQQFTKISNATATGYDMDFGMIYTRKNLNLGLLLQRGVELKWANGRKDSGALTAKFGISNKFMFTDYIPLLCSVDFVQRKNQPIFAHAGTEIGYEPLTHSTMFAIKGLYLRFGLDGIAIEDRYGYRDRINNNVNLVGGFGIKICCLGVGIQLDYVFGSYRLGDKHRTSINLYF